MRTEKMKEAKVKAGKYCAYQERTQQEVRDKLYSLGLHREEVEEVLTELIMENFVNEERYAKAFASGKFRMNQWGKSKIIYALKQKKISAYCIDQAMKEIDEDEYLATLNKLIEKRKLQSKDDNAFIANRKIANYLVGKGYEQELIWSMLTDRFED